MGLRDEILSASDLRYEDVLVPEWGGVTVRVTELHGSDRVAWDDESALERESLGGKQESHLATAARFLRWSLRDPVTGDALFQSGDHQLLAKKSPRVLQRLFAIAVRMNAIGEKEIESAAGKSDAASSAAPPTA